MVETNGTISSEEIRKAILSYVYGVTIANETRLWTYLEEQFPTTKVDQFMRKISELVQSNEIKRFSYILAGDNNSARYCFYTPISVRLMD